METVLKVKALSKFGFFVEGEEKGIVTAIKANEPVMPKIVAPVFNSTPEVEPYKKVTNNVTMTKADWNAKDRSMMIGGLAHDAAVLAAAAATANVEIGVLLNDYEAALKAMVLIREEMK